MNLYPHDLGHRALVRVLRRRTRAISLPIPDAWAEPILFQPGPPSPLFRLQFGPAGYRSAAAWNRALSERALSYTQPVLPPRIRKFWPMLGGTATLVAAVMISGDGNPFSFIVGTGGFLILRGAVTEFFRLPLQRLKYLHAPLTLEDIEMLISYTKDPVECSLLRLAQVALTLPEAAAGPAETNVRRAIQGLSLTLEKLTPVLSKPQREKPGQLQAKARQLAEIAAAEPDPIVAASLERRVHTLTQRAQTALHTATLLRRDDALRQEIDEQIAAVQTSLFAFQAGGRGGEDLAQLAQAVDVIAAEARAVSAARVELETDALAVYPALEEPEQYARIRMIP